MSQNYVTILTYLSLLNSFNMNQPSLIGSGLSQPSCEASKPANNIIVLSSDDDDNTTPKSRTKSQKSSGLTIKRTQSQLSEKTLHRRSTKSVLNSNFSLEDHQEPESAETDFNSPVAQKRQASKVKQQQKQTSSSQRKISQITQINQSQSSQEDNTLRKKSFFEELEEIAYSFMTETNKKVKVDDSNPQSQQSLYQQSSSTNLISLCNSLDHQSQQLSHQLQQHQQPQYQNKQLDLIQEEEDEEQQISNNQSLKQRKQATKVQRAPRAAPQKKQTKINQKQKQRGKQIAQSINDNSTINYQNTILINNNNQPINCANPQTNFPLQPKTILLNQNTFKFQEVPKKIQPPRAVFAEEVYLKSISQEGSIKLQKFPCFRESDLQIPSEFSNLIQQQFSDDDKCSGDELLEKAVNYMHKKLVASTIEQNPSASIPDAERTFTIRDIKIDRDSEEEDEEELEQENQYSSHSNCHSQYSPYGRQSNNYQNKNNFLSDDEDEDDDESN